MTSRQRSQIASCYTRYHRPESVCDVTTEVLACFMLYTLPQTWVSLWRHDWGLSLHHVIHVTIYDVTTEVSDCFMLHTLPQTWVSLWRHDLGLSLLHVIHVTTDLNQSVTSRLRYQHASWYTRYHRHESVCDVTTEVSDCFILYTLSQTWVSLWRHDCGISFLHVYTLPQTWIGLWPHV